MVQIAVEVKGKNINCSADETWFTNSVRTPKEFFPRDLGEIIYTAECSGYLISTDELYKLALEAYNNLPRQPKRSKTLVTKTYSDCVIRISVCTV